MCRVVETDVDLYEVVEMESSLDQSCQSAKLFDFSSSIFNFSYDEQHFLCCGETERWKMPSPIRMAFDWRRSGSDRGTVGLSLFSTNSTGHSLSDGRGRWEFGKIGIVYCRCHNTAARRGMTFPLDHDVVNVSVSVFLMTIRRRRKDPFC